MRSMLSNSRLLMFTVFLMLSACGGGDLAGGVTGFETVLLSARTGTTRLESDVVQGNTCSDIGSSGGTFLTDTVNFTVTSTVYPKFTGNAFAVAIDSYTVQFMPANTASPQLPDLKGSILGTMVSPGGAVTIPVAVATDMMKYKLVNDMNLLPCTATMYEYYVKVTFEAVERFSGKTGSFSASFNAAFADRI